MRDNRGEARALPAMAQVFGSTARAGARFIKTARSCDCRKSKKTHRARRPAAERQQWKP
jgi:hypothetical protein